MKHGTYTGPPTGWNLKPGLKALIKPHPTDPAQVLAQFDDWHVGREGKDLAFGWHPFPAEHFSFDE